MVNFQQFVHHFSIKSHMDEIIMSACMNTPAMSITTMLWFSHASTTAVRNTASVDTVGDVVSSFAI